MARRANGEGTIGLRQDGRWQGRTYVLLPGGARVRRTVYGRTRAEVHEKITALVHQSQRGIPAPNTGLTLEGYLTTWLDEVVGRNLGPRTHVVYETAVRRHIVPSIGKVRLSRLSASDVRRLLNAKADSGLAPGTVKKLQVVLSSALQQALRDDLVTRNVARLVQVPASRMAAPLVLDVEEARRLLEAARTERLYALWAVALGVGLRKGEALGLRWTDVDFEAGTLCVRRSLQRVAGELRFLPPKTATSRRVVPLPETCARALESHRRSQDEERRGPSWRESGLVFSTPLGTPIDPRNLNRFFDALCARAGVRRIRVHDLRHTCATVLLAQGVPPRVVMDTLGHSKINVTLDLYAHVSPVMQREAATRMNDALTGGVGVKLGVSSPSEGP